MQPLLLIETEYRDESLMEYQIAWDLFMPQPIWRDSVFAIFSQMPRGGLINYSTQSSLLARHQQVRFVGYRHPICNAASPN
jgi:hypothetical protein